MKKTMIAGSALFLSIAGFAVGQGVDTQLPQDEPAFHVEIRSFDEVDINSDGILNRTEADAAFPALGLDDDDQDGNISKAEVKVVLPKIAFEADDMDLVGAREYDQIVAAMEDLMKESS